MIDVKDVEVGKESFSKLPTRIKYNYCIAEYYEKLSEETTTNELDNTLHKIADRLRGCSTVWDCDYFRLQATKAIVKTNRCRDKFCLNCQSALALAREHKFAPILNDLSKNQSIYHCIFTVPNCSDVLLKTTIKAIYTAFSYLIRYFSYRAKVKGVQFVKYGFKGGIKSFEITYNKEEKTYHPHLHCIFVFDKNLNLDKKFTNKFSYSKDSSEVRYFSEEEILFQKIWYLLINGQLHKTINSKSGKKQTPKEFKVNKKNIDSLDLGYSVVFNKAAKEDYKEVFKYAFAADFDSDKCLGYEQLKLYRTVLKNLRFIQAYGDLINYDFSDDCISAEDLDIAYEEYKSKLYDIEEPVLVHETVSEMLNNMENAFCSYITSGSIKSFLLDDTGSRLSEESKPILEDFKNMVKRKNNRL